MTSTTKLSNPLYVASSCGDIHNISNPFRLKSDPEGCDLSKYELACEDNRIVLYSNGGRYYVLSINYYSSEIRLVDDGIQKGNCSSLPHLHISRDNRISGPELYIASNRVMVIMNCSKPVSSSFYIAINPSCIVGSYSSNTSSSWKLYALANPKASDVRDFCTIRSWTRVRYSYSNIKKITANFKHKLGEGGYGSVYKGTLRSGNDVAIKILKQSKAHGQDFINEVATIGRIYHVNVVQLIGFCFEGSKQALVYDLMSNGSLDKQIFNEEGDKFLDYKKIYEIALGVAGGIEYLHRGCDMQILHFDIKPHNILLDKNFIPKVSNFGLAKLNPANHSMVSLTNARGTLGYMAPELFYRNIGGVSYKADVYSFGMLLMEVAGDIDELQMPPKPLIYPPDVPINNDEAEMELETFSTSSSTPIIYTSFPLGYTNDV
ncbi:rust resistance kinase Lr10-like [Eucalyptus grandis]|uniref:rust resistance kinase Lr10-like n=1 Tax=Eucalyptus grandis TaxID=71139 RepID=UPI00192E8413|nr:rust resistance kinase Lr10-like [Eucalyptus grandis]